MVSSLWLRRSGVDPLRRVAEMEIPAADEPRRRLERRAADLLGGAGIDRRFEDHDGAGPQMRPDRGACRQQRPEIRPVSLADRRRHRHDEKTAAGKRRRDPRRTAPQWPPAPRGRPRRSGRSPSTVPPRASPRRPTRRHDRRNGRKRARREGRHSQARSRRSARRGAARHPSRRRPAAAVLRCSFQDLLVRPTPARRDRDEQLPHCG